MRGIELGHEHTLPCDSGYVTYIIAIYFSDFFEVAPEQLEDYGAFNISLINDLPLFVDPFLLFDSKNEEYRRLHDEIIRYVKFLRDECAAGPISEGNFSHWFFFPEVSQNWLGFSRTGNRGSGLGSDFARSLHRNLVQTFRDFGTETISRGSHLEKLCLIGSGVGRDHLSDFTTNLIKHFLIDYTQTFARTHVDPTLRKKFAIDNISFDYEQKRWRRGQFELPAFGGDFVLLTPKDILTKDEAWINRGDLLHNFEDIYNSIPNEQLRAQVNDHFRRQLFKDATAQEVRTIAAATVERYPQVLDYYVKQKEDASEDAHRTSAAKVAETQTQFVDQVKSLVRDFLHGTEFYELGNSFEEALRRVHFLKEVIENQDGYRLFYVNGKPVQREADLQIMYRLTWFATAYDVNREVNNGRGPVDFKVSKGRVNKSLVEFKLASNTKLRQNLQNQVAVYEAANDTANSIKAILYFTEQELERTIAILKNLGLTGRRDVVLIDACKDNKPSGSNAKDAPRRA